MKIKRLKIKSFAEIEPLMKKLKIDDLADFFILYESKNQEKSESEILNRMEDILAHMRSSVKNGLKEKNITRSGMVNGGAYLMNEFIKSNRSLINKEFSEITKNILAVAEGNACMNKIVAAPTAGAAGVIPGVLLTIAENHKINNEKIVRSLFVAGGIGEVITLQASLSGAVHGCQAEVGSASAMTAAAIAYLFTNDIKVIESSAAFALKSVLGLVCDPVAGLVEIPCIKRNVMGGFNAISSAEMALAGIKTVIPLDEVIKTMDQVGDLMVSSLKETSLGGLAATSTGKQISKSLKK
jgi:L-serine dehydratase